MVDIGTLALYNIERLARANKFRFIGFAEKEDIMIPLTLAGVGEQHTIVKIGGSPEVKKHLENLGFVAGGNVTVVNTVDGNLIVNVKEARVAISREMAVKIMI